MASPAGVHWSQISGPAACPAIRGINFDQAALPAVPGGVHGCVYRVAAADPANGGGNAAHHVELVVRPAACAHGLRAVHRDDPGPTDERRRHGAAERYGLHAKLEASRTTGTRTARLASARCRHRRPTRCKPAAPRATPTPIRSRCATALPARHCCRQPHLPRSCPARAAVAAASISTACTAAGFTGKRRRPRTTRPARTRAAVDVSRSQRQLRQQRCAGRSVHDAGPGDERPVDIPAREAPAVAGHLRACPRSPRHRASSRRDRWLTRAACRHHWRVGFTDAGHQHEDRPVHGLDWRVHGSGVYLQPNTDYYITMSTAATSSAAGRRRLAAIPTARCVSTGAT